MPGETVQIKNGYVYIDGERLLSDIYGNELIKDCLLYTSTPAERANPDILSPSRKHRIAKGAGVDISEVNRMIKQFNEMKKLMKQFGKPGKKKKFGFPF